MNKNTNGLIDLSGLDLDPAIAATISSSSRKQADARLPKEERKARSKDKRKNAARRGNRASYDLDADLIKSIQDLAVENGTTASQVAGLGLAVFLDMVKRGEIDITTYRVKSDSPHYEYRLERNAIKADKGHPIANGRGTP